MVLSDIVLNDTIDYHYLQVLTIHSRSVLPLADFKASLTKKFRKYGYVFDRQNPDAAFYDENGEGICEVDIWLENGEYVMVIEVKTKPKNTDINEHIKRIAKIRAYFDKKNDNRKILGAIACGTVKKEVLQYAHKKGFYVIVQSGEAVEIVEPPEGFKVCKW